MNATFKGNNSIELSWKPSTHGVESYQIVYTDMWEVKHILETKDVSGETIHFTGMFSIEPRHEISNYVVCATSKASDQPAHTRSLIRAFASRLNIL